MFSSIIIFLALSSCVRGKDFETTDNSSDLDTLPHVITTPDSGLLSNKVTELEIKKVYSFTKSTKNYKNFTYEDIKAVVLNVTTWEPPSDLIKTFPYYLAGYDYDKRPVWVFEIGKIDFRSVISQGEKKVAEARFYLFKIVTNVMRSFVVMDTPEEEIRDAIFIFDMQGASLRQVDYLPSWKEFAHLIGKHWDLTIQFVGGVILLNANYVAKLAVDVARPVIGSLLERVEVYGSSKNVYLPRLLKRMPMDVIPPWYGGKKDFKPLAVFG